MSVVNDFGLPLVTGISLGSVYGLAAMGLVLTYKTSGLFNFGQGAVAAAGAYVFYGFFSSNDLGFPWEVAAAITVLVYGPLTGLLLERLSRGLANVAVSQKIVGTIGLLLIFRQLGVIAYGANSLSLNTYLPHGNVFAIGDTNVTADQIITALLALGLAVALFLFFRKSRLGTAMRGVVDDPSLLDMTGENPARVRRTAWMIGSSFAALSGILIAPQQNAVDGSLLTILVVQAFGAAIFGFFQSLPLAYVGGLAVGFAQALVVKYTVAHASLSQLGPNAPFLVLFLGLLVVPKGRLVDVGRAVKTRAVPPSSIPRWGRNTASGAVLVGLLFVPLLVAGSKLIFWSEGLADVVLFLSLGLLVRTSGQVSLCQVGLSAVGAVVFSKMVTEQHLPWVVGLIIAGVATIPIGAIIAIPAIRLSGLYLALATLGFGVLLSQVFFVQTFMFGSAGGLPFPRPGGFTTPRAYFYVMLFVVLLCSGLVLLVEKSRIGRLLRALSDSPTALVMHGASTNVTRVIVFCVSAFLAGISGALFGPIFGRVDQNSFNFFTSLILLAVLALATSVMRPVPAAFLAAFLYVIVPGYITDETFIEFLPLLFGLGAVAVALLSQGAGSAYFERLAVASAWRSRRPSASRRQTGATYPAIAAKPLARV